MKRKLRIFTFLQEEFNLKKGVIMIKKLKSRTGNVIEVDTSSKAFQTLPQEFLQHYRHGDRVILRKMVFVMVGVGNFEFTGCNFSIKVIWGFLHGEERISCRYPIRKGDFQPFIET